MESWLSGLKRLTANEVRVKPLRGFESLPLRKVKNLCADKHMDFLLLCGIGAGFESRSRASGGRLSDEAGSRVLSILRTKCGKILSNS